MLIQKSVLKEIWKSLGKRKLEELKQEIIAILQKQEEKDYKKAIEQFSKEEKKYKYLEKSISGEWIEKAGYGIGTVRVWKGKKYKKIAPGKWARMYEKEGRGTNIAVGHLIAKVKKIDDIEELMNFVMQNKQRFQDENGMDLPILDKIRAEVDRQSGKIESKGKSENTEKKDLKTNKYDKATIQKMGSKYYVYTEEGGREVEKFNTKKEAEDYIKRQRLIQNEKKLKGEDGYAKMLDKLNESTEKQGDLTKDDMKKMAKEVGNINSQEIMEKISKEESNKKYDELYKNYFPIEPKMIKDAKDKWLSKVDNNKITDELVKNAKDQAKKMNDVMLLNKLEEFKNKKPIDINVKNEQDFKHWVLNHISNKSSYSNSLKDAMRDFHIPYDPASGNTNEKNELALSILEKEAKQRGLIEDNKESKTVKKEETKAAFKGRFATDKQIDYVTEVSDKTILSTEKMLKKPITTIQRYAISNVEDFKGSVDKFIEYMADRQSEISLDEIAKEWARLVNHNVARKIWESYQGGALEINDDGYFQEKKEEKQQNQMTPKQQKTFDDFEKKAIKKASNADQGKRFAKHNYNIDGEDWTITTDGKVMLCSREKFEEPTKTDKITNMDKVFLINGQKESAIPDGIDAIIKAAPKTVVTGKDYNGKEKKEFSIIKLGDRYFNTDYLKIVQNFLGPLSNAKMQVIPGDNKSRVKFESGNKAVVLLPIENGAELENRIINTKDIKKSLEDIIMFCNDFEDEDEVIEEINNESLFNDYSAENPELFNSIAFKVEEVLNECGICGL